MRAILFDRGTPLTDALTLLYHEWGAETPTLFDVMAVAYTIDPSLCPAEPLAIVVDNEGFTRPGSGTPNTSTCLASDSDRFFHFVLPRLMREFPPKA
jgi:inosine-uridine nucleoside N-ribohydrolase